MNFNCSENYNLITAFSKTRGIKSMGTAALAF